ncbi:hypothetical protein B0H13DRAFT_1872057 [Mycena leptocephala]|nr:hypothetical protein B0H13DRAFT_1872057 [Mycena leptocephala]
MTALNPQDHLFGLIHYVFGGWLIGSSAVFLLEGILISQPAWQVNYYYTWCSEDPLAHKVMVAVLAITWTNTILYMHDPTGTVALREWYEVANIPLVRTMVTTPALRFTPFRWKLSEKWWYIIPLVTIMILGLGSAIITTSVITKTGHFSSWFAVHVLCTFATDVLITGASTYFLVKAREQALSRTRKLLGNLIKISCQNALPATTATLIELICSRIASKSVKPHATNSIILVLLDTLPIVYANCMLYMLNVRRSLRNSELACTGLGDSCANLPGGNLSRGEWRPGRPVELTSLDGVQMQNQRETVNTVTVLNLWRSHDHEMVQLERLLATGNSDGPSG